MTTQGPICIAAAGAPWRELNTLLQQGVWCRAMTPAPLLSFLADQIGIDPAYIRGRIETIFLDGMVVDDLDRSVVLDGSTVTLSAAMPGLVGATLRRGGFYAAMRSEISWSHAHPTQVATTTSAGLVRVKLFNLVLREIGPDLLRRGVLVEKARAAEAFGDIAAIAAGAGDDGKVLLELEADAQQSGDPAWT